MRIRDKRHPEWMKVPLPAGEQFQKVRRLIKANKLHTVCQSAHCPNIGECWGSGTATFMILGDKCTRNCRFCNVQSGVPAPIDEEEPERVAEAVAILKLNYAVVTSVTRDDLPDGGARIFAETIKKIRSLSPHCKVEVLIPDFKGEKDALNSVFEAKPDVLNHNLETVPSLYEKVRPGANYNRSLNIIKSAHKVGLKTKSGLMVGLGETFEEIVEVMKDLRVAGCNLLTIGQYLQPSSLHLPIDRYVTPDEFKKLKILGYELGFDGIESGPLVRSSYHAAQSYVNSAELDAIT